MYDMHCSMLGYCLQQIYLPCIYDKYILGPDIISWGDAHDGPVISLERSMFIEDLLISVGGKVFAIWKENMKVIFKKLSIYVNLFNYFN